MTRTILVFSDGGERVYPSRRDAEDRIKNAPEHARSNMRVVDVTEGTRDEIVAEWLRERIREASWCHEQWKHEAGMAAIIGHRIEVLTSELDMLGVVLEADEQEITDTLRPPRDEQVTLDESEVSR